MRTIRARLKSVSPYSQSRSYAHEVPALAKEKADMYEERTWRSKATVDEHGNIMIPPMALKLALDKAANMLSMRIPGKGQATYSKFFKSGVLCMPQPGLSLPVKASEVQGERVYAHANGIRGSGRRVWRIFPVIHEWETDVDFTILAGEITPDVFAEHLRQAGAFVGIGRFRPENGGFYGRFAVKSLKEV